MNIIEVNNISKRYEKNEVLQDINFQVEEGEFVAVMGQSGCGKTTLFYCISGMDRPSDGEVFFNGQKLSNLSGKEMESLRLNHMGFIFQRANFLKNLTIEDNIIFPAFQAGNRDRKKIVKEAEEFLHRMGISHVAESDIRKVSGGQLQRAAICRAMINHPDILFGDEPTGALNSSATGEVMDILERLNREGTTLLLVTHDAKVAARAGRIIYLEDGRIKEEMKLGRYAQKEQKRREERVRDWLEKLGF